MYHMTKYIAYCIYCLLPVAAFGFPPPRRWGYCGERGDADDVADMLSTRNATESLGRGPRSPTAQLAKHQNQWVGQKSALAGSFRIGRK